MMKYTIIASIILLSLFVFLAACGTAEEPADEATAPPEPTATTAPPTAAPTNTPEPAAAATATPAPASTEMSALEQYAAENAGGPGAIFVGDLSQMVGLAPEEDLGGYDGDVPLDALEEHLWIYESDYYQTLLEKAKLTDPTELVSSGHTFEIQHACINRTLLWCQLLEAYFVPNVLERTNGQVRFLISSFPELGLAGPDTMHLLTSDTLDMAEIYGGYVGGEYPSLEVQYLWGVFPNHQTHYSVLTSIFPDIAKIIIDATGGQVILHNWVPGDDQFFFSDYKLDSLDDFEGLKTRSHSAALSDWIEGMGADAQFVAFAEVYAALERGILDAGVTGASPGYSQRWYEVTDYMNGRLYSFNAGPNVMNETVWSSIPEDLQQIILEEGARNELEALRLAAIQNRMGVQRNVDAGLTLVEFDDEMKRHSFEVAAVQHVIPAWLNRVTKGSGDYDHPAINLFNDKIGPKVGVRINDDGSVEIVK